MKLHSSNRRYRVSNTLQRVSVSAKARPPLRDLPASEFQASTWVKLQNPPTTFSFDEALLLCQYSANQWLGWIPDYGEVLLSTDEFYQYEQLPSIG